MAAHSNQNIVEVEFTNLVYGGDAMARLPDGRVLFAPFAIAGEKCRVRIVEERQSHARGELLSVMNPSPARVQPRCRHFGICGGCHYQHIAYDHQLEIKRGIVREQLQRLAGITDPQVEPTVPSPLVWNYRNSVQFHIDETGAPGYQRMASHDIVAISECHLPEDAINDIWPKLDMESIPEISRIELRQGSDEDILLVLEGRGQQTPDFSTELPLSCMFTSPSGRIVLAGNNHFFIQVSGRSFRVSAESFFQVNTAMATLMVDYLIKNLPLNKNSSVMDLYCGVGLFSAFLAPKVKKIIGIELSGEACEDFVANLDEFNNVELYQGAVSKILPLLNNHVHIIVVDPPRSGLEPEALASIIEMRPDVLAYVSCDPATLSRDAKKLVSVGYKLTKVTPFDLFPHTYHIETISLFTYMV
jgi:23S rRNA (uracil1939-C5)-methyltransferase